MAKIRRSKTNTKFFTDIPKIDSAVKTKKQKDNGGMEDEEVGTGPE